MRPDTLKTKIFLDGGDPGETKNIIKAMGFLDGQTTNPTLIRAWSHLPRTGPNSLVIKLSRVSAKSSRPPRLRESHGGQAHPPFNKGGRKDYIVIASI